MKPLPEELRPFPVLWGILLDVFLHPDEISCSVIRTIRHKELIPCHLHLDRVASTNNVQPVCYINDLHVEPIPAHVVNHSQVNLIFEVPIASI